MGVWIIFGMGIWGIAAGLVWALIYASAEQTAKHLVEA